MESKREYTNVTFRVPQEDYIKYKVALLQAQIFGRKTPTADLNAHIRSVIEQMEEKK